MRDEIALVLSLLLLALCGAGIYSRLFRDNWLQMIGMGIMVLALVMIGWHAWTTERTSSRVVLLLLGLLLYGIGTAWKSWHYRNQPHATTSANDSAPGELDQQQMRRVAGGSGPP